MNWKEKLTITYKTFSLTEGSQHIASEFAILKLQTLIREFRVKNVLEVGLGIGSIAGTLLILNKNLIYTGTEANEFCRNALRDNLKLEFSRLKIYHNLKAISREKKFDLIIIDGKDDDLNLIKKFVTNSGIIAIEGDRVTQKEMLSKIFPNNKHVHLISLKKNKSYSPFPDDEWQGGLKIIFTKPTTKQHYWWLKEKILTKVKYQYPGRYLGA